MMPMYIDMEPRWYPHKKCVQQMKGKELSRNETVKTLYVRIRRFKFILKKVTVRYQR